MSSVDILLSRIRQVRRKWRLQLTIKGISLFLGASIALLLLGIWGADLFGFKPGAVWVMRILTGAAVIYVAARFLYFPLRRRISDVQVAQYIEERYPYLEDRLITAVEFGKGDRVAPGMLDLLIKDALDKINRVDFSVFMNRKRAASYGAVGATALFVLLALLMWGPSFLPYGFERLYVRWTEAAATPLLIQVLPGHAELAKGSDQQIKAQLVGFDSPDVKLMVQPETGTVWSAYGMEPERVGSGFLYLLIDVQSSMRYYVESKGLRSETYTLKVVDLPRVEQIDLTYNFPAYAGMAPQTVENDGDVSALKGTRVDFKIRVSQNTGAAKLMFDDRSSVALAPAGDKLLKGTLNLQRSGSYVVQLVNRDGRPYAASSEYQVEAVEDTPPKVSIIKPLRDLKATNVEEVFAEMKAEDDIGMAKLELRYSVNGAAEKGVTALQRQGRPLSLASPGHTPSSSRN